MEAGWRPFQAGLSGPSWLLPTIQRRPDLPQLLLLRLATVAQQLIQQVLCGQIAAAASSSGTGARGNLRRLCPDLWIARCGRCSSRAGLLTPRYDCGAENPAQAFSTVRSVPLAHAGGMTYQSKSATCSPKDTANCAIAEMRSRCHCVVAGAAVDDVLRQRECCRGTGYHRRQRCTCRLRCLPDLLWRFLLSIDHHLKEACCMAAKSSG